VSRQQRTGVYELPEVPELYDILRTFGRRLKLSLRTNTVGTVTAYNPATQKVTVTCDILRVVKAFTVGNTGAFEGTANANNSEITLPVTILKDIPVAWPRCGGGYLTFPIVPGDTGILTVMDRSLQQWLLLGAMADPVQAATHALQDSVFEPGLHPDTDPITPPTDATGAVLHHDALIKLGRAAVQGVVKDASLQTFLSDAATTASIAAVPQDGGKTAFAAFAVALLDLVAAAGSTKVRTE